MLIQMNCIEFNSRDLGSLHYINTDRPAAGHRSRCFGRLQLEHKASTLVLYPTYVSRDKHLSDHI